MAFFDFISKTAPNGHFVRDMIVFGGLHTGGSVAKGFVFEPPDMANAAISELNAFQNQLALLLASLDDTRRLQIQWFCDSDYRQELLAYHDETQQADNVWTRRVRNERFTRYWEAMTNRKLRRQRLVLWISRKIDVSPPSVSMWSSLTQHYDHLLEQLEQEFIQVREMLDGIFAGQGTHIIPMKDEDHYRHYARFLNPSFADRFDYDPLETYDPRRSIQENCWHSEGNGLADSGFWMDGHYHSILTISRMVTGNTGRLE